MPDSNRAAKLRFFALSLLLAAAFSLVGCAPYGPRDKGEKVYRNVAFAKTPQKKLLLDLYVPKTAKPAPVVVWVFGGSWKIGLKSYHVNLRHLTRSGIALAAIQYRLSDTAKYPAQLEDCQAAVEWLRQHGAEYGVDPKRIGMSGESAGGHLAALTALVEGAPKIKAVCAIYPPTDILSMGRKYKDPTGRQFNRMESLLGGPIEEKVQMAKAASPVNHVSHSSPPFLIFHGDADTLVPIEQSKDLDRRLRKAGVESTLVTVHGKPHWFELTEAEVTRAGEFFRRHFGEK